MQRLPRGRASDKRKLARVKMLKVAVYVLHQVETLSRGDTDVDGDDLPFHDVAIPSAGEVEWSNLQGDAASDERRR